MSVGVTELDLGESIGPYRLDAKLGEGGMGVVFRAVRVTDGATVALKVLKRELASDAVYKQRFLHEARAARAVVNKHLVPIIEAGEADGYHYLAVTCIEGRSLDARIETEGPLPIDDIVRIVADVAAGLSALHREGLVHRDVKPTNILLNEEGDALLTDFGLARGEAYTVLTKPGHVMGTIDYLAPELIKGATATPSTDIYALGCTAYQCLTALPPFAASRSAIQIGLAHLQEEPPDPCVRRPDVAPRFCWTVMQALAKEPERRPPTATAYAVTLTAAARQRG
jgi:serine/threonine protein kinase